jgi:hypothetical protein
MLAYPHSHGVIKIVAHPQAIAEQRQVDGMLAPAKGPLQKSLA